MVLEMAISLLVAAGPAQQPARPPASRLRDAQCERLWRDYFRSQRCHERYRNVGGSIKGDAAARCGEPLPDPSAQCGPLTIQR